MENAIRLKTRKGDREELTTISAITRGCLNGLNRKARTRLRTTTMHICRIARGRAKSRGSFPWNTPFDVAAMGAGHVTVAFEAIFFFALEIPTANTSSKSSIQYLLYYIIKNIYQIMHSKLNTSNTGKQTLAIVLLQLCLFAN